VALLCWGPFFGRERAVGGFPEELTATDPFRMFRALLVLVGSEGSRVESVLGRRHDEA
jgi:hypothetical protein